MDIWHLTKALNLLKPGMVVDAQDITVGLANTSYLLTTDGNEKYVLRQLRLQTPDNARTEAKLQALLSKEHVATPMYLSLNTGDVVGEVDGCNFTISNFIAGSHSDAPTLGLARSFGETLAKIHHALKAAKNIVTPNAVQWLRIDNAQQEIARCPENLRLLLEKRLEAAQSILHSNLPMSVVHADLFLENTFTADDRLEVVFDLETVEYTVRLLDIARTYISFAFAGELDQHKLQANLFDGYNDAAQQKLTTDEVACFPLAVEYAAVACAAWLQNNHGEEFVEPYLAVGINTTGS